MTAKASTNVKNVDAMFLPVIFLIFFSTHAILWLISCCCKIQGDDRIIPRKEHENYIRYERQEYLDSLRK
jgi:hypothetical protein